MDPSFHILINVISNGLLDYTYDYDYDYDYDYSDLTPDTYNNYDINMTLCNTDLTNPFQIEAEVTDALYVTLSWVS